MPGCSVRVIWMINMQGFQIVDNSKICGLLILNDNFLEVSIVLNSKKSAYASFVLLYFRSDVIITPRWIFIFKNFQLHFLFLKLSSSPGIE